MKITYILFAILILIAAAEHHSFRHRNDDGGDYNDHNDNENHHHHHNHDGGDGGDGSDNGNDSNNNGNSEQNFGQDNNNYNNNNNNNNYNNNNYNNNNNSGDNSNANSEQTINNNAGDSNNQGNTNGSPSGNSQNSGSSGSNGSSNSNSNANSNSGSANSYIQTCLEQHNNERNSLGLNSVTWNSDLADASMVWAKHLSSVGSLSHSSGRVHIGENVASTTHRGGVDNTVHLIGLWLDEKRYFKNGRYPDISTSGNVHDVGHYSQMIWAATSEIGCATATGSGEDFMCCQYKTSGNVQGQKVY